MEGKVENEEEDMSRYWVTLRKQEGTGNWKTRHKFAPCREPPLEEGMDQLKDRLQNDKDNAVLMSLDEHAGSICRL
jgi:hypothetical protein